MYTVWGISSDREHLAGMKGPDMTAAIYMDLAAPSSTWPFPAPWEICSRSSWNLQSGGRQVGSTLLQD